MRTLTQLGLTLRTARHLEPLQAAAWALHQVRRRLPPPPGAGLLLSALGRAAGDPSPAVLSALAETTAALLPAMPQAAAARAALAGRFEHLHRTADLGWPVDWRYRGHGLLWCYHLNYLDELPILAQLGDEDGVARLVHGWRDGCAALSGPPWDPYPTALRTLNLARALAFATAATRGLLCAEIARGACWLAAHLEVHLGANHLLADLHALAVSAALLPSHPVLRRLRPTIRALLRRELDAQILPDGGHYERSPMYHALVTAGLCELRAVLAAARDPLAGPVADAAARAARFQETIRHPDGTLPAFNDSTGREPFAPDLARALAGDVQGRAVALLPTGLVVLRAPDRHLVMDCGPIGPDHQPGHAHADALSFELSVGGQRVVINAGIRGYADDPSRAWSRSTAAHSTVQIGDGDQIELWSAFRVGRRAAATLLGHGERRLAAEAVAEVPWPLLPGRPVHRRRLLLGADLLILDSISAGDLPVRSRLHLHPDVAVEPFDGALRLTWAGGRLLLTAAGATVHVERAPVFPDFGVTREGAVVVLETRGDARIAVGLSRDARVNVSGREATLGALSGSWP